MSAPFERLSAEVARLGQRLSESEAGLRAIVDKNADGIVIVDEEDGEIRFANPAATVLFARSADELSGSPFGFPVVAGERAEIDIVQGRRHAIAEMRGVHIAWDGRAAWLVSLRDVTEQRRAEEALRRKEEQLHASRRFEAVGRLVAEVAYDINNILMGISGVSGMVLEEVGKDAPARRLAAEIMRASDQGTAHIRRLFSLTQRRAAPPVPLDVNAVLAGIAPVLRRLAGSEVVVDSDPGPALWSTDGTVDQIEQVLVSLVLNARDAMPAGGRIVLRTRNATLAPQVEPWLDPVEPGEYVLLEVSDTGAGMDPETRAHVFEPLFTTKKDRLGTGLGLSTVRAMVEEAAGHVQFESEPGRGTTFQIYLPRSRHPVTRPEALRDGGALDGDETVLIVDEEALIRLSLRDALERRGYRVLDAARGAEALAISKSHDGPIDVLLADLRIPWMTGLTLAQQIEDDRPRIEVVYMTAYATHAAGKDKLAASGAAILEKPFTPEALLRKLRDALDRRAPPLGPGGSAGSTVLLVEEDATTRAAMRSILELRGHAVLSAASAEEALRIRGERGVDLLLTDLDLPSSEMNGAELARRLLAADPAIRLVVVSAHSREAAGEHDFVLPEGTAFVEKPVRLEILERAVEAALGHASPVPRS